MPNIENLKKQAKQYLRWHRERYYPVAAAISATLPRFRDLSDEQVLEADFKLADAQELVARQRGFESWPALKSGADAMTQKSSAPLPVLTSTAAQLFVADITAACDFYTLKLGFTVDFVYGDPPFYGQVSRDHAKLALRLVCETVFAGDVREREQLLSAALTVATTDEIKQLFLTYQDAGVQLRSNPEKGTLGRQDLRRSRSRWQSHSLCRSGRLTRLAGQSRRAESVDNTPGPPAFCSREGVPGASPRTPQCGHERE